MSNGFGVFLAYSLLGPVVVLGVIGLVIAVVAGGKEPDPTGLRVRAVYLTAVCFVSLFVVVSSAFAAASSLTELIGDDPISFEDDEYEFGEDDGATEGAVSGAVLAGLVGAAGAVVYVWHRRRMEEVIGAVGFDSGAAKRPVQAYHYAVAFVSALVAMAAAAAAAYALYRIAAPDYSAPFTEGERTAGARQLLASAVLLGASGFLFARHVARPRQWEPVLEPAAPAPPPPPPTPPAVDLAP